VKRGSILVVEHLDRLSRQGIRKALALFNEILDAGVSIATLKPNPTVYRHDADGNDIVGILIPIIYFYLAGEYSANLSRRLKSAWETKRKTKKWSNRCPSWLTPTVDGFIPNEGAKAVRFIFKSCVDGIGQRQIIRELQSKFKPIGTGGAWTSSFIFKVLRDRAVLGELQPKTKKDDKRIPIGDPIPDYYPAVIDEALFNRAQAALARRRKHKGPTNEHLNLFSGLVFNANDGHAMHRYSTRSKLKSGVYLQRRLLSYGGAKKQKGADHVSIDYDKFEALVLTHIGQIRLEDIEPANVEKKLQQKQEELAGIVARIEELTDLMADPYAGDVSALFRASVKLGESRKNLEMEIGEMQGQQKLATPLKTAKDLLKSIEMGDKVLRRRLRNHLASVIERILVKPEKHFGRVYWTAQICYRGGAERQIFCTPFGEGGMLSAVQGRDSLVRFAGKPIPNLRQDGIRDVSIWADYAAERVQPQQFKMPKRLPQDLEGLADVFLQSLRSKLSAGSFKTIPSKVRSFVDYVGDDVSAKSWESWIGFLRRQVKMKKMARNTARVGLNRTREFVLWLHLVGARKRFDVKGSAAKMIP